MNRPFKPYHLPTKNVTLSGSSQLIELPQPARSGDVIKVVVNGSDAAFIEQGDSAVAASTTTSMPQLGTHTETYELDTDTTHIAINGAAGSTVVYVTMGTGI